MPTTCKNTGGAQQIVGDRRAEHPGGVRPEAPRRHVRQRPVDEVGEDGFDDRVPAMGDIGVGGRGGDVGEKRLFLIDGAWNRFLRPQDVGVSKIAGCGR